MLCCVGLFGGLYVGQSLGGHWTITAPAIGFGLGLIGDTKLMRGMHGHNSSDGHHKSKMSSYDSSPKLEEAENLLLQGSDINTKEVQRDSG
jgi:hypothetical protein